MLRCRNGEVWANEGTWQRGTYLPAAKPPAQPVESGPFEKGGKRNTKINCMPCPKYQRPSSLNVPHEPVRGSASTALALPIPVCTSLQNQLLNTSSTHASTVRGFAPPLAATLPSPTVARAPNSLRSLQAVEDTCFWPSCKAGRPKAARGWAALENYEKQKMKKKRSSLKTIRYPARLFHRLT